MDGFFLEIDEAQAAQKFIEPRYDAAAARLAGCLAERVKISFNGDEIDCAIFGSFLISDLTF